ncbi:hypothetical protein M8J76_004141 [Diaphorina citri]|nr:hypothetical protein M8J76_004141 [Diaphorina citri]
MSNQPLSKRVPMSEVRSTFCVVSKRFRKNYIHRFTATNSLFIFSAWGYLRRTCIFISTNQYFDYMVMTTILLNCVFLAKTESVEEAEYIFLAIYTAEMIIKIVAKGFFINKYTYLRNPWNWLDFIVIASGYATIGMEVGNLAGLRTFRVLRALKTVSIMPGLKTIINALLHSFKQLAEVMTLTIFCLMVFALFALQVYMGELRNKCVAQFNGTSWADLGRNQTAYGREWKKWINNDRHWLMSPDNDPVICGNVTGARKCPAGYVCLKAGDNPNHGYTNFDNFLWSMLTTFQLITLDYWENVYNMVLASSGPLSVVFFTVVVFFGSFYLINLMLAVVALSYEEEAEITQEERRKDLTDHRDDSTFSFDPTKIPVKKLDKNNMKKIDSKKGILLSSYSRKRTRRRKRRGAMAVTGNESQISGTASRSVTPSPEPDTPPDEEEEEEEPPRGDNVAPSLNQGPPLPSVSLAPGVRINRGQLSSRQASSNASEGNNRESSLDDSGVVDDHEDNDMGEDVNQSLHPVTPSSVVLQKITERMKVPPSQRLPPPEEQTDLRLKKKCNGSIQQIYTLPTSADYMSQVVVLDNLVDRNCAKCPECCIDYESWLRFQNGLYRIVRDPLFELLITLCIILNTMFLAVEHHGMSQSMRDVLDYGNKVFTLVFTLECILKVMALSNDYFQCGWNIFDLIVVTASLVDLMTEFVDGLSVLRGLRLLRVLKLAQSWTTMKVLLSIIISTIGALGNLTFVLVIVIYIFAVIGMQLFSKDYTSEKWNFSDFFHSFMMIFRILCGEWIEPLWDCMRAEEYQQGSGTCFAIFLPALVMGNFMVLNLFLALLLNSFNSDELKSKKEEVGEGSKLARSLVRLKSIIGKNKKHFGNNEELKDNNANLQLENLVREVLQNKNTPKPALTEETLFSTDNELDLCEVPPSHSPPLYYSPTSVAPPNLSSSQLSLYHHHHQHPPLSLKSPTLSVQSLSQQYNAHLSDSSHPTHLSATILKPSRCCCIHARSHGAVPSGSAPSGVSAGHGGIVPSGAIGIVPSGGVAAHGGVAPHWGTAPSGASVGHGGIPSWTGPSGAPSDEVPGRGKRKSLHAQDPESPAKASSKYSNNIFRSDETEWRTEPSSRAIKSFKDRLKGASPEIVNEKADRLSEVTRRGKRLSLSDDANKGGHLSKRFSVPLEPNKTEPTLVHSETQSTSNNASSVITHLMRPFHHQGASSSPSAVHSPLSTAVSSGTLDASGDPHRTSGLPSQAAQSDASSALPSNLPPATGPSLASDVAQRTSDLPSDTIQRVSNLPSDVGYRQDLPVQTSDLPSDAATRVPNLPSDARNDLPAHRTNLPDASHKSDLPPLSAQGGNAPTNLQSNTLHGQLQSNGGHSNVMPSNGGQSNAQTNEAQSGVSSNGVQSNAQPNGVSSNGVQSNVQTNGAQSRGVPSNGGQSIAQTNAILSNIMSSNISQSHGVSSNAGQSIAQTNGTHSNVSQSNGSHSEAQTGVPSAGVTLVKDLARAPLRDPVSHRSSISMSKSPHRRQSVIHQSPSLHQIAHQQNICCCQFQVPQSGQLEIEGNGEKFARTFSEDNKHSESYNEDLETDIMKRYDSVDTDYTFRQDALYRRIMEEAMMAAPTLSSSHLDLPNFDELYTEEDDEFRDYCQGVANYRLGNPGNAGPGNKRRSYMLATQQISSDSQDGDEPGRTTRSTDLLTGSDSERKKPWVTLVSYVDELTVGGRRDSQGRYIDGLGSFPGFGRDVIEKEPEDCFPEHCYQRCPCCLDLVQNFSQNSYWVALRRHILYIVDKPLFEWFILVLIFASSLTLCFEDIYLDTNLPLKRILYWVNLVFSVLFTIEMVFKWIALGFYKYFGSMWTLLDFFIVFVSVVSLLIEENENLKVLRSLRTLRALRPLRAISKWQGMRIVVNALMYAIPSIFNVLLVCLVFWLIFSIMGVQFFGGKFYKCLDENDELLPIEKVNDKFECLAKNYTWINSKITFDNVGDAYLALFQVATFEGWMEVMADAVDARGVDQQPQYEANLYAYIYFVIFIVCGSFFTLNLFIGVIIDNFNMLKKKYEGGVLEMFLTESQKHYYTAMKKLGRKKPQKVIKRPLNQFLAMFYDLSNSRRFEIAIFVLIFLNMLSMGIEHYDQNQVVFFVLEVSNAFFTTVFSLEALVKIIGLRYHYFTVPWNLFDFLLVLASILGILMEDIMIDFPVSPTLLRVVRVFRIGRILRLIKAAKGIRKLLFALVVSLPALFNIGALLGLITFIYAIIGMSVFGHVRHQRALDDMVNFETFGRSMQLLFRLMTSAGWNDVLESLMIQPPDCDMNYNNQPNGNCGYPLLAITYFTSFIIISYMIVINMYIAIILENFNQAHQEEEIGIVEDDLEMFYIRWSKFDPHATQFISFSQLADFIASLDPPLGIPKPNIVALVSFNLPIAKGNKIHCLDILHALVKHVLGHVEETEDFRKLQDQMDVKFKKQFPTRKELEIVSSTRLWKRQDKAARMIQRCYREYKRRRKELEAAQTVEEEDEITANSSPGGWQGRLSAFLHVHRGSRASSRKSSRASDAGSDASEMGAVWLNLPLFLLTGAQPGNGGPEETLKPSNDVCITVSNPSPETVLPNERDFMTSPPAGNMAGRHDSLDLPEGTGVEITVTEPSPDQDAPIPDSTTPSVSRHGSSKSTKSMKRSSIKKPARSGKPSTSTQHDSSSTPASSSKECSPSALKRANTESCPPASVRRAIFRRSSEAAIGSTAIVQAASTIVTALVHRESEENESHDS